MVVGMGRKKKFEPREALERAMDLFWRKGYEGTHLQELVDATGMSRFSLYEQFGGKVGLFEATLKHYLDLAEARYFNSLGKKPFGLKNIYSYFNSMDFHADYHGCFMINTLTEKGIAPERAYRMAKNFLKRIEMLHYQNVKAAQENGEVSKTIDPESLAQTLFNLDLGLAISGIAMKGKPGEFISDWIQSMG